MIADDADSASKGAYRRRIAANIAELPELVAKP